MNVDDVILLFLIFHGNENFYSNSSSRRRRKKFSGHISRLIEQKNLDERKLKKISFVSDENEAEQLRSRGMPKPVGHNTTEPEELLDQSHRQLIEIQHDPSQPSHLSHPSARILYNKGKRKSLFFPYWLEGIWGVAAR